MPRPTHVIGLFGLLLAAGCSSSSSAGGTTDAGTSQDSGVVDSCAPLDSSFCGQPCQPGNSLGVGTFCNGFTDCTQLPKAHLCATAGDPGAHFCTFRCSVVPEGGTDASDDAGPAFPTDCGEGASCKCGSGGGQSGCACTPDHC